MNKELIDAIKKKYGLKTDRQVYDFIILNPNLFTSQTEDSGYAEGYAYDYDYSDGYAPITTPNYSEYEQMKKEKETFDARPSRSPIGVKSGLGYNYFDPIYENDDTNEVEEVNETPKWKEYFKKEPNKKEEPNNISSKRVNPLLTLGLLDTVGAGWTSEGNKIAGDNTILNMYNSNLQNERNRAAQYEYNRLLKEMDKADKDREYRLIKAKALNEKEPEAIKEINKLYDKIEDLKVRPEENVIEIQDLTEDLERWLKDYPHLRKSDKWQERSENRIASKKAKQERALKVQEFGTTIPRTFKTENEKNEWYKTINENPILDDDEKARFIKQVEDIESLEVAKGKASQGAKAGHTGKKTTEGLDEADNKKKAKDYNGKTMNSLEWNALDKNVKQYLKRDGSGKVTYKG